MAADDRPNVVFILRDNTGWGDWGVYRGNTARARAREHES
jgi:arylsulfatase A-like enzyme